MKRCFLIVLLLYTHSISAQPKADSLLKLFENTTGKNQEEAVRSFSKEAANSDVEKIKDYAEKLQAISKKLNSKLGLANSLNLYGTYYYKRGQYNMASHYYEENLNARKEINDTPGLSAAYNNMGNIRLAQGNYKDALEYHFLSLKIKEALKDEKGIAMSYNNIATVYRQFKQPQKAIQYHKLSLAIKEKFGDKKAISYSLTNIANAYYEAGEKNEASYYYGKALKLQKELNDDMQLGNTYNSLGYVALQDKQYKKAAEYFALSLKHHLVVNNKNGIATTYMNMGELYIEQDSLGKAQMYLNKSLAIAKENNDKENIQEGERKLSIIAEKERDYKKALALMQSSQSVRDSLFSADNQMAIAEMQTKYETEKKEAAIKLLEKNNELKDARNEQQLYIASGIIGILLVAGAFSYMYLKAQQQKRVANEKLEEERKRLNAIIQTQEEERKRISAELHDGIGPLLSAVKINLSMLGHATENEEQYATTMALIDQSYKELRQISHTMMPAMLAKTGLAETLIELVDKLRLPGSMDFSFYADEENERYSEQIEINTYRITQELLNNIVRHANAKEVTVQLYKDNNELSLMIEDNGDGFDVVNLYKSKGNGWTNIQSRLNLLGGSIEIDSKPGRKGTVVHVIIPLHSNTIESIKPGKTFSSGWAMKQTSR